MKGKVYSRKWRNDRRVMAGGNREILGESWQESRNIGRGLVAGNEGMIGEGG
jgi:hypothetical protein